MLRKSRAILTESDPCKTCGRILPKEDYRWLNDYRRSECKRCASVSAGIANRIKKFNLSPAEYNQRLKDQKNLCYICHDIERYHGTLSVDHNHETGKIRKLLCSKCNRILGLAKEDVKVFEALINYVKEHENAV